MHLLMLIVVTCWSANIVAGKEAVAAFGTVALAQFRTLGAAFLFAILFFAWPKRSALRLGKREWVFFIVMALSGVTLNQLLFIGGIARTSVAHTGLIVALGPVMVLMLACLMRLEELTGLKLAGMGIAFAGVGLLTLARGHEANGSLWAGDLVQLAATAVFAYYTILMKEVADRFDALTLNALTFGLGALMMLPFSLPHLSALNWSHINRSAAWSLAFMIVPGTILPYLLYAYALTGLTASRVAAFNYLQPVIAIVLGMWMLAERISLNMLAAGALILLGVYFTEREPVEGERFASGVGKELRFWM
jgi:drug/metabolite transporter (DMT)-like permease